MLVVLGHDPLSDRGCHHYNGNAMLRDGGLKYDTIPRAFAFYRVYYMWIRRLIG